MKTLTAASYLALALVGTFATCAAADTFRTLSEKGEFLTLLQGKNLTHLLYNIELSVLPDGSIKGAAMGWDISGSWNWQDGYFCRDMNWGGHLIPYNCQLVEAASGILRFTVDQGSGRSASLRLR